MDINVFSNLIPLSNFRNTTLTNMKKGSEKKWKKYDQKLSVELFVDNNDNRENKSATSF